MYQYTSVREQRRLAISTMQFTVLPMRFGPQSIIVLIALLYTLGLIGCQSPRETAFKKHRAQYHTQQGHYSKVVADLNDIYHAHMTGEPRSLGGSPKPAHIDTKHSLLWRSERGILAWLYYDLLGSEIHLSHARERIEYFRASNLLDGLGSALINDTVRDFVGEAFEHDYIWYQSALVKQLEAQASAQRYIPRGTSLPVTGEPLPLMPSSVSGDAKAHYDQSVNFFRGLTEWSTAKHKTATLRYRGHAFFHALAAMSVLSHPRPLGSDYDYAAAMLYRARQLADRTQKDIGDKQYSYFEQHGLKSFIDQCELILAHRRGPEALQQAAQSKGLTVDHVYAQALVPEHGQTPVLLLNHVDFIAKPEVLDIGMVTASVPVLTAWQYEAGFELSTFTWGGLAFYARGPDAQSIGNRLAVFPVPRRFTETFGPGISIVGFALPVHKKDSPLQPDRQHITLRGDIHYQTSSLPVVADLDAVARATLKDRQPHVFVKTLLRMIGKQVATHQVVHEVQQKHGELAGMFSQLIGSVAMTASEVADTRSVTLLPDHIRAQFVMVDHGSYDVEWHDGRSLRTIGTIHASDQHLLMVPCRTWPHVLPPPKK